MYRDDDFKWDDTRCWINKWALCETIEPIIDMSNPNTPGFF